MLPSLKEYVFVGTPKIEKLIEFFKLLDAKSEKISFIVPECYKLEMLEINEKYKDYINIILFILDITKKQIAHEVDIYDKSIDKIKVLYLDIKEKVSNITGIIPSCEAAVYPVSVLRTLFKVRGLQSEQGTVFRDKFEMKEKIALQSNNRPLAIKVPKYAPLEKMNYDTILNQAKKFEINFPMILKPRSYGGSFGVFLIRDLDELKKALSNEITTSYELNEYIDNRVAHSNGIVDNGKIIFVSNYYYNETPFKCGCDGEYSIAHIEISDINLNNKIHDFASEIIFRLGMETGVFHLEFFIDEKENLTFLEIAARPPGAIIVPVVEISTGINLQTIGYLISMNHPDWKSYLKTKRKDRKDKFYGEYIAPIKYKHPIEIINIDLSNLEGINLEKTILPKVGSKIAPNSVLYNNLGVLLFSGSDSTDLFRQYNILEKNYKAEVRVLYQ